MMARQTFDLCWNLFRKELQIRYASTTLGFLWALAAPALTVGVYVFVFTQLMPGRPGESPLRLVAGLVHWVVVPGALIGACDTFLVNGPLLRKARFPKWTLCAGQFGATLLLWIVAVSIYLFSHSRLLQATTVNWSGYAVLMAAFLLMVFGASLCLACFSVRFRDTRHAVELLTFLFFWITPVVYEPASIPPAITRWLQINPLYPVFNGWYRVLWGRPMSPVDYALPLVTGLGFLLVGVFVYRRFQASLVDAL